METPVRTIDLPIAGKGYSGESLKMVFDLGNLINNVSPDMWKRKPTSKNSSKTTADRIYLPDDSDGAQTLRFLGKVNKVVRRIGSNDPKASLGLHPIVYFYGSTGKFLPVAFLAVALFVKNLETKNAYAKFTQIRSKFEIFLIDHRGFINQIGHEVYGNEKRIRTTLLMYEVLFDGLIKGKSDKQIVEAMKLHPELKFLQELTLENTEVGKKFSTETKSAAFLRETIDTPLRCSICNARLPFKAISFDHKNRKQDGGLGTLDNAQLTHPYCNTGYKEMLNAKTRSGRK